MEYYARFDEKNGNKKQLLKDHLDGVARLSVDLGFLEARSMQRLLALLHDFGKASATWQEYLFSEETEKREKVPHSPHGAYFLTELSKSYMEKHKKEKNSGFALLLNEVLQFVILAHHGIFDATDIKKGTNHGVQREEKFDKLYGEVYRDAKKNFLKFYSLEEMEALYSEAVEEFSGFANTIYVAKREGNVEKSDNQRYFDFGVLAKMLLSTLIDSDWSNSAAFLGMEGEATQKVLDKFSFRDCLTNLETKLAGFRCETPLEQLRKEISLECARKAESLEEIEGVFKLDLPTGAGKTLSIMRFALIHAQKAKKNKIFYIAPFNSILDQTAGVYKDFLVSEGRKEEGKGISERDIFILEHYGDALSSKIQNSQGNEDFKIQAEKNKLAEYLLDTWSSPIILTSMVQLLLTLFSDKSHSIRRLHSLYNSVIIVDEVQSVPVKSIGLFNMALNSLAHIFRATIILTTATQPPFENDIEDKKYGEKIPKILFVNNPNLLCDYSRHSCFHRVEMIFDLERDGRGNPSLKVNSLPDLIDKIKKGMKKFDSMIVVLNTRNAAADVFMELKKQGNSEYEVFGLSNNMYKVHRMRVLKKVKKILDENREAQKNGGTKKKIVLVSTPLIEAGVDISFEYGIRSLAGLHTIAQTAGRINRNGELEKAELLVVKVGKELENTERMKTVEKAKEAMSDTIFPLLSGKEKYGNRLDSKEALTYFFNVYYQKMVSETHYNIEIEEKEYKLIDMLSAAKYGKSKEEYKKRKAKIMNQGFKTAGRNYKPIGEELVQVLVEAEESRELIADLNANAEKQHLSYQEIKNLLSKASDYSVGMREYVIQTFLNEEKAFPIKVLERRVYVLKEKFYGEIGLIKDSEDTNVSNDYFI